jgi:hypothetical protein
METSMIPSDFLPATRRALPYPDVKSCEAWLAKASLGDCRQACAAFLALLGEIEEAPPPCEDYLQILESLRPPMLAAIGEHTRKFSAKPLPLSDAETAAFTQVSDLWFTLLRCYRRLLRAAAGAAPADAPATLPLLAARAVGCAAELICANLLARREVPSDLWQWLHVSYAFVEARGLALPPAGAGASCAALFAQAVLFDLARPQGLSQRDAFWALQWTRLFAHKVRLMRATGGEQAYAVDLGGGAGATWRKAEGVAPAGDAPLRFLNTGDLAHSLRSRLRRLDAGDDPGELGLGRSCTQPGAGRLLRVLLRCWCSNPQAPRFPRRAVADAEATIQLAAGYVDAHAALSGRPFRSEVRNWDYGRQEMEQVLVIQRSAQAANASAGMAATVESWQALDESACGFRLRRSERGARVIHRQLVALKSRRMPRFMLAEVRWLQQSLDQALTIGVQALPGLAQPCAVRPASDDPARQHPCSQAFLLPQALGAAASLILPAGWYQRERLLDLHLDEGIVPIRLCGLLDRGHDYDRASFTAMG